MDGKLNLFAAIAKRMDWLGQRQKVLAENIANSDTPGYRPRDLKQSEFSKLLRQRVAPVEPAMTHAAHRGGTAPRAEPARPEAQKRTYETAPSGNAVDLEEQLIKVAKTQDDYQTMTNLYRKHMEMFRIAVRGGN